MQPFPKLSETAQRVLKIILSNTSIDGSRLIKHMDVSRSELAEAIRELQTHQLIEVGGATTSEELPFARFGVRPSAKEYLHNLLKQNMA